MIISLGMNVGLRLAQISGCCTFQKLVTPHRLDTFICYLTFYSMIAPTTQPMASEATQAADTPSHEYPLAQTLRPVFKKFLKSLNYTPTPKKAKSDLYTHMHLQALSPGVPYEGNAHSLEIFNGAVAVAEVYSLFHQEHTLCEPPWA